MAVYKRSYRAYAGALTPRWSRFLILTRYSAKGLFRSRALTGLFVLCFFNPLLMIAGLYLNHNTRVLSLLGPNAPDHLLTINGNFFMVFMGIQAALAFLIACFVGPNTISPDLANNALPLYFCRPLSRAEYVLGRGFVICYLLSLITWIPGLALFGVESTLSGAGWGWEHRSFAIGVFVGSWLWIGMLTLISLALSAWVRWRIIAGGLLLGVMFVSSGVANAINAIVRTKSGYYLDPSILVASVWGYFFDVPVKSDIPPLNACLALAAMGAFCVFLLAKKVRAFEVVR
jgi:ABC-2 type transport system permease protein